MDGEGGRRFLATSPERTTPGPRRVIHRLSTTTGLIHSLSTGEIRCAKATQSKNPVDNVAYSIVVDHSYSIVEHSSEVHSDSTVEHSSKAYSEIYSSIVEHSRHSDTTI